MKNVIIYSIFFSILSSKVFCQILPLNTNYNQGIVWESVFTDNPSGKVNRGLVDSDGNCAVIFMPQNMSRIHN